MNIIERMDTIREMLEEKGYLSVEEAVEGLSVSIATVRRDFKTMVENHEVERYHGGIMAIKAYRLENRFRVSEQEKRKIASRAADLIKDNDCIYIDSSSTTYYLADYIQAKDIVVITNSYLILPKLAELGIRVYVLNGFIENGGIIIEGSAEQQLLSFVIDKAFLGVYGISPQLELTTYNIWEGDLKKKIIGQVKETYVLADSSKFERCGFYTYSPVNLVTMITDKRTSKNEAVEQLVIAE